MLLLMEAHLQSSIIREFVIPLAKYRRSLYGTQLSAGMRFGMMFETEESGKRRYRGTIVGTSDLDPLRWPGSKWRNLQVEWDEPGSSDKHNRVSPWEIETPDSLFIFPSPTSSLKRPLQPSFLGARTEWENLISRPPIHVLENLNGELPNPLFSSPWSEQLIKMLIKPQTDQVWLNATANSAPLQVAKSLMQARVKHRPQLIPSEHTSPQFEHHPQFHAVQPNTIEPNFLSQTNLPGKLQPQNKLGTEEPITEVTTLEPVLAVGQLIDCDEDKLTARSTNPHTFVNELSFVSQNHGSSQLQSTPWFMRPQLDSNIIHTQQIDAPQLESDSLNGLISYTDTNVGSSSVYRKQNPSTLLTETLNPTLPSIGEEMWDHQMNNSRCFSEANQLAPLPQQDPYSLPCLSNSYGLKDLSDESHNQSDIYGCLNFDSTNGGSTVVDPFVSSTVLYEFCMLKDGRYQNHSDYLVGSYSSSQDVQSQITSASIGESQALSVQEFPDNSGGASSSNTDIDDSSLLQNSSWHQVAPRVRTYTKIQKLGSVGRSIDVSSFKNYDELCSEIEHMFGLKGLLNDSRGSGWKLVYVDFENDILLVGDDPWEEFVGCVRCIRILSPPEVQQMGEEGLKLLNSQHGNTRY